MTAVQPALAGVLVAAGQSRRMGGADKLWLEVLGRPIWRWSLDTLLAVPGMGPLAVVVPAGDEERFGPMLPLWAVDRCRLAAGGAARADSVRAGLQALADAGVHDETLVLVHDAARPAASVELMVRVAEAARLDGAAIPAVPVGDTLTRVVDGRVGEGVDRGSLVAAQTPQAATLGALRTALARARDRGWEPTDEAAALTAMGLPVTVVEGEAANRKLTEPSDAELVVPVLRGRLAAVVPPGEMSISDGGTVRAGIGVDAHRWAAGRPLRLGGLDFPDQAEGLAGHSDGDAALHAAIDALLGAAGLGDIGTLFPADPEWRGADSAELLRDAAARVRQAGWRPRSVDLAIAAERPPIAPRRAEMAERIGPLVGLPPEAVSVRGTTTDGLGFPGSEGVAAWAVVLVERPGDPD